MENQKITVAEYLNNKELLTVNTYIPYANKVNIVDAIMKQVCMNINGTYNLDSVLLDRVKKQIFIESCTNLDLNVNDNNLDGYDLLCSANEMNSVIELIIIEYSELERLLELRVNDYIRDKASVKGTLNYKIEAIMDYANYQLPYLIEKIDKIDTKSIIENISHVLDKLAVVKTKK